MNTVLSSPNLAVVPSPAPDRASFVERHFCACAAVLLLAMCVAMVAGVFLDSVTYDEPYHLRCGYALLKTGELQAALEHGPLAQIISALPLLALNPNLRGKGAPSDLGEKHWDADVDFLYNNRVPAVTMVRAGRAAKVLLTLLLGVLIAWWTRRHFGAGPALAALLLFSFDPTFIAHGHLSTTDVPAAFAFLAGCLSFNAFLTRGTVRSALFCGLITGFALAVKYSMLLLPMLYVYLYFIQGFRQIAAVEPPRWRCGILHFIRSAAVIFAGICLGLYVSYGFETRPLLPAELGSTPLSAILTGNPFTARFGAMLLQHPGLAAKVNGLALHLPIPAPSFLRGFLYFSSHNEFGHVAYLLGRTSGGGWWFYFPVAFSVKTPAGLLALLLLAIVTGLGIVMRAGPRHAILKVLRARQEWYVLTVAPLMFFALALKSHINIGIRHVLPIYPFVFIGVAVMLFSHRLRPLPGLFRKVAPVCLALVVLESASAFPRYIGFFNAPSGGPGNGWKYLSDSNLDWGQDMDRLHAYLERNAPGRKVCLTAFSVAPPSEFGIAALPIPASLAEARAQNCLVVVSKSVLYDWHASDSTYDWIRGTKPTGKVAESFWVYDFAHQ